MARQVQPQEETQDSLRKKPKFIMLTGPERQSLHAEGGSRGRSAREQAQWSRGEAEGEDLLASVSVGGWGENARKGTRGFIYSFIHSFIYLFIYLFRAALGLHCCAQAFSSCGERGLLFVAVRGFLIAVTSLVAECGL